MSAMSRAGLPIASMNTSRVLSLIAASTAAKSLTGVKFTLMPAFGRIASNWLNVPP